MPFFSDRHSRAEDSFRSISPCDINPSAPRPAASGTQYLDGRWRSFGLDELLKRDKVVAVFEAFVFEPEDVEVDLPDPDILVQEIADDLEAALAQFTAIATKLKS